MEVATFTRTQQKESENASVSHQISASRSGKASSDSNKTPTHPGEEANRKWQECIDRDQPKLMTPSYTIHQMEHPKTAAPTLPKQKIPHATNGHCGTDDYTWDFSPLTSTERTDNGFGRIKISPTKHAIGPRGAVSPAQLTNKPQDSGTDTLVPIRPQAAAFALR